MYANVIHKEKNPYHKGPLLKETRNVRDTDARLWQNLHILTRKVKHDIF